MFCDRCGTRLPVTAHFCPSCGKNIAFTPLVPVVRPRTPFHVRRLGFLWLAYSMLRLIPGLFLVSFFGNGGFGFFPHRVPFFGHGLMQTVGGLVLVSSLLGIIAGW